MRVILIHGFNADPEMNFHPWLAEQLKKKGFEVIALNLPLSIGDDFNLSNIIEEMREKIGVLKSDDIILGHSLGSFMVLQYLEAVEMVETPRAVIMVSAPWKVSRPELRQLFLVDLDADVLMWKTREFIVIHSEDDKLVPIEHGRKLAKAFKARLIETKSDGHFMDKEYPVLLETIIDISKKPFEFEPGTTLKDDFLDQSID